MRSLGELADLGLHRARIAAGLDWIAFSTALHLLVCADFNNAGETRSVWYWEVSSSGSSFTISDVHHAGDGPSEKTA